ncbi:COG1361 family protein [Thalassotalea litorea]|uniref:hypothetical protein n=1 Tax=Thalassotalea litorea TaxID=2020715 RepID=UPI003734DA7E
MKFPQYPTFWFMSRIPLIWAITLAGILTLNDARADFFPQLNEQACLADYSGKNLTCTANDIQVSQVTNIRDTQGNTNVECSLGEFVTIIADVTVVTTANERYGYGIWLPEGAYSAKDRNTDNSCSVLIGDTNGPGVAIDDDVCADISKASGFSATHEYLGAELTLFCRDDDNSEKLDFNYCASWNQKEQDAGTCDATTPTPAGSPSKCRCDSFDIDVFIKPPSPTLSKTLVGVNEYDEPGGEFTFDISFENTSDTSSIFIERLEDVIDLEQDGTFETTLDLWGTPTVVDGSTSDGVYLTASDCPSGTPFEVAPNAKYECQIKVHVVGKTVDPSPEIYDDVIKAVLKDKNDSAVGDGSECPSGLAATDGDNCSQIKTVQINNVDPRISVDKTVVPDAITESTSGTNVDYTVTITNEQYTDDSNTVELFESVDITEILDAVAPVNTTTYPAGTDIAGDSDCQVGTTLAPGASCDFTYTMQLSGNNTDYISNQVTVKAKDDEQNEVMASDTATVTFTNSPGMIKVVKTADDTSIPESGQDVIFTFDITNTSAVDTLTLTELTDTVFGTIFDSAEYNDSNEDLTVSPPDTCNLYGIVLTPGQSVSCTIVETLQGEPGAPHTNLATVKANTDDTIPCDQGEQGPCYQEVMDDDGETVNFENEPADATLDVEIATTLFVTITNNSDYEAVNLTKLQFLGQDITTNNTANYRLLNDGGTFNSLSFNTCDQPSIASPVPIAAGGTYTCAFTVELIDNGTVDNVLRSNATGGLEIDVVDPEGGPADTESIKATVQLVPLP